MVRRKLNQLHSALQLKDLASPDNRLERLKGNLAGLHSIRVNDQWRIVFQFDKGHASAVLVVDYH